jgi:hypothetical protein
MRTLVKDQKIKGVALLSFEYPPRRLTKTSDVVFNLAKYLSGNGIKVWVLTFDDWRSGIEIVKKNWLVNRIPFNIADNISTYSMILNLKTSYQSALATILNEEKIEIIHLFEWQTLPLVVSWGGNLKQKLVYTTNSIQLSRGKDSPTFDGMKKLESLSLQLFDRIITHSNEVTKQLIEQYEMKKEKINIHSPASKKYNTQILDVYNELMDNKTKG